MLPQPYETTASNTPFGRVRMSSATIFVGGSDEAAPPVTLQTATMSISISTYGEHNISQQLSEEETLIATRDAVSARLAVIRRKHPPPAVLALTAPQTQDMLALVVPHGQNHVQLLLSLLQSVLSASMTTPTVVQMAAGLEPSSVSLLQLTETSAAELGKTFSVCMLLAQSPEAAAEQFISNSLALKELAAEYELFKPAVEMTAKLAMKTSNLGATFRLFFAAGLSMFDFVTDIIMILDYYKTDQVREARMLLGMLGANLVMNMLQSYFQNRRIGWKAVAVDWLLVLSYLKPGVDAWKVASGAAHEEGAAFDPTFELTFCKGIELVTESIPGKGGVSWV